MAADLLTRHPVVATTELEVAREQVAARYCPHTLALARRDERLDLVHNAVALGEDVVLNYMRYGGEVRITPGRFLDFYLVQIPLRGRARVRSGDRELVADRRTAFVGSPDEPVDMRWTADCAKLVVYVRRGAVEELGVPGLTFDPVLALDRPAARDWMRLLGLCVEQLEVGSDLLRSPVVATSYEQALISGLLALQPNNALTREPAAGPSHAVRTARALIDGDPGRAWRVADLARLSGVSARTLQDAFRRELDTTPLAEVRGARLERARGDLVAADPLSTTVAVVAARWGFFHLGRFAQAYRDRFHELPSQTLAR
ncbi:AraC family transcriptional regulator [Nocardioides nitrophenolicus]|uniref:AraC family transcriptional regulator n=1 Tax=Nocardioides nitrophenolicus TaxID=60489 RepID=UPI00195A40E2|nr:AraC family transcriptional regulator [Nocardioides nitrophenolicus]MBM7519750.1 AraC-like DNA-binding protein [Nocardioides nitrophenolicus]